MRSIALLLAAAVLLSGCVQNEKAAAPAAPSTPTATESPTQLPQASPSPTPEAAATQDATAAGGEAGGLLARCMLSQQAEWTVKYAITSSTSMGDIRTDMTQYYKDGGKRLRTDISLMGIESRAYVDGDATVSCTRSGDEWKCTKAVTPNSRQSGDYNEQVRKAQDRFSPDGAKTVAGIPSECFKGSLETGAIRYCLTSGCVPVYIKVEAEDGGAIAETEVEAESVSMQADDSAFGYPAQPADAPAAGGECAACGYLQGDTRELCIASCRQ